MVGLATSESYVDVICAASMQVSSNRDPHELLAWLGLRWPAVVGAVIAAYVVTNILQGIVSFISTSRALASIPTAPESSWFLGNALAMMANSPWEKMNEWVLAEPAGIVKVRALNTYMVIVGSPQGMKQVFQTKQRDYGKDVSLSYQHFLNILGAGPTSGLVTAEGEHWRRQRSLMGPTLRTDILDAVIGIGKRAADRLSQKLEAHKASGQVIDMEEEFRLLTLQVIGEAMLSLPPEECDEVGGLTGQSPPTHLDLPVASAPSSLLASAAFHAKKNLAFAHTADGL